MCRTYSSCCPAPQQLALLPPPSLPQVMCRTYSRSTCAALRKVHGLLAEQAAQLEASVAEVGARAGTSTVIYFLDKLAAILYEYSSYK
jgi:hypothetical protein